MSKYMHTIDGQPAYYIGGMQICYVGRCAPLSSVLVDSLRTIRAQQRLSRAWRAAQGFPVTDYGYVRFSETRRKK